VTLYGLEVTESRKLMLLCLIVKSKKSLNWNVQNNE